MSWDKVWHVEALVHEFLWFSQGKSPWHLKHQEKKKEEDDQAASDFSSRKQAFNATWLKGSIAEVVFK